MSSALETLSWILADPGEVVLTPVPAYARFFSDMKERMKTEGEKKKGTKEKAIPN